MTIPRTITAGVVGIACCGALAACGSSSGSSSAGKSSDPVVNSTAFIPFCEATLQHQKITSKNPAGTCQCIQRIAARRGRGNLRASQLPAGGFPGPNGDTAVFLAGACGGSVTGGASPPSTTTT